MKNNTLKISVSIGLAVVGLSLFMLRPGTAGITKDKPLAEIYKTGKVRFVPELTISDQSMNGKDFFSVPTDLAWSETKGLFVCDIKANNVKVFDGQGNYLKTIGKQGQGPGDFNVPIEVELSGDRLYVRELMNRRVSILDPNGKFIKFVSLQQKPGAIIWRMAALPDSRFIIEEEESDFASPKAPQQCLIKVYSAELEAGKVLYQREVRRNIYISEPRYTNVPVPFAPDVRWGITPDGKVVIGYSEKCEFQGYDVDKGRLFSVAHTFSPVEVTAQAKEAHFGNMVFTSDGAASSHRGAPDYIVKNTVFPKYYPAFESLMVDPEGNVWLVPYLENPKDSGRYFDAFDKAGKFLRRVMVEGETALAYRPIWTPRGFWAIETTDTGEHKLVKYRISE